MVLAPSPEKKEGSHGAGIPPPHLRRKRAAMMLAFPPPQEGREQPWCWHRPPRRKRAAMVLTLSPRAVPLRQH